MQIFVRILGSRKTICLEVRNTDTIGVVKSKVEAKEGIPPEFNRLYFSGQWLQDDRMLPDYNINAESTLTLAINLHGGNRIRVRVRSLTGIDVWIHTTLFEKVKDFKAKIQDKYGYPVDQQRLIFSGFQLEDERLLIDYNIRNGSLVHIVLRLRGGGGAIAVRRLVPVETRREIKGIRRQKKRPRGITVKYFKTLHFPASCNLSTIADVKAEIEKQESYPVGVQRLILHGRTLDDDYVFGRRSLQLVLEIIRPSERNTGGPVTKDEGNGKTCDDETDCEEPPKRIKLEPSGTGNKPRYNLRGRTVY